MDRQIQKSIIVMFDCSGRHYAGNGPVCQRLELLGTGDIVDETFSVLIHELKFRKSFVCLTLSLAFTVRRLQNS